MIFPPANLPVPPEAHEMYPSGVRFLALGVGLERMTPEGYDKVVDRILPAAQKLAAQGANAISVMGTSLTFYKGAAFDRQLKESVTKATGLPSTTMSTAIVEGLRAVGGHRLAVATAYNEDVSHRLRVFLEESGFDVLAVKGLGIERFEDRGPVTHDELLEFSAGVWESAPKADALVVSCGALKTLDLLVPLEARCKVRDVQHAARALARRSPAQGRERKVPRPQDAALARLARLFTTRTAASSWRPFWRRSAAARFAPP